MTAAFADCLHVPCPTCHAPADAFCTFVVDGKRFKHHGPCVARLRAAERALEAS